MNVYTIISPGHGGSDPGCIFFDNSKEKEHTLKLGIELNNYLKKHIKTKLLRSSDVYISINDRCKFINTFGKDCFTFDLHFNSLTEKLRETYPSTRGTEIFVSTFAGQQYKDFASFLCKELSNKLKTTNRGMKIKIRTDGKDYYGMIRDTKGHTFIIEVEFGDQEDACILINSYNFYKIVAEIIGKNILTLLYGIKVEEEKTPDKLYCVQTGAFSKKSNAINQVILLKKFGFSDSIIIEK